MLEKPNVELSLAASRTIRGIDGYTNSVVNALDQRKINMVPEPILNEATGKLTWYLVNRPGAADKGGSWGVSGQVAHLWEVAPGAVEYQNANLWLISTSSNAVRASDTSTTHTITTAPNMQPTFIDKTSLNGIENLILQLRSTADFASQQVFYTTSISGWTPITSSVFTGLKPRGKIEPLDGYLFALTTSNRIHSCALNDPGTWPELNFITKEIVQDRPMGLAKFGRQILAFGLRTMEVWRRSGSSLESVPELFQNIGLSDIEDDGASHYYARYGSRMYFISSPPTGFWAWNGQSLEKVSTPAIDKILASRTVFNVSLQSAGNRSFITLSLDHTTSSLQRWLTFQPDWKDWSEWRSNVCRPVISFRTTNTFLGVGANQHKMYRISLDADNWLDDGADYPAATFQFKLPSNADKKFMEYCGVVGDTERNTTTSVLTVEFSDDDGQTWSTTNRTIDMTKPQKITTRCGSYHDRLVRISHTGNTGIRLEKFVARIK